MFTGVFFSRFHCIALNFLNSPYWLHWFANLGLLNKFGQIEDFFQGWKQCMQRRKSCKSPIFSHHSVYKCVLPQCHKTIWDFYNKWAHRWWCPHFVDHLMYQWKYVFQTLSYSDHNRWMNSQCSIYHYFTQFSIQSPACILYWYYQNNVHRWDRNKFCDKTTPA